MANVAVYLILEFTTAGKYLVDSYA